ncbi:MAG: adenosylcobinamide-GDP ribazoletransferase [Pseudomonadota bacterium]
MRQLAANELAIFGLAVQFLTRVPIPVGSAYTPERLAAAPRYYPMVGALVGALSAGVYAIALVWLTPIVAVLLAIAIGLLVTGAFHEDGLADTFDGLGAADRDGMLTIMRDSRLGTYGTLALLIVLAIKVAALMGINPNRVGLILIAGHGLSRLSAVLVIATSRYARDHGTGKPTADGIDPTSLVIAVGTGAALLVWMGLAAGLTAILFTAAGALLGHLGMRALFERRLRGYTGDTLGAVQQTSELGVYLGLLAWQ